MVYTFPKPPTAFQPKKPTSSSGTYDSSTGTYTSPQGEKQSMAKAPAGSTLVGGGHSSYVGGGQVNGMTLPVITPEYKAKQEAATKAATEQAQQKALQEAQAQAKQQAMKDQQLKEVQANQQKQEQLKEIISEREKTQKITVSNPQLSYINYQIQTQPYIKKELTKVEDSNIPQATFIYVDPTGLGPAVTRSATPEEVQLYKNEEKALSLEKGTASVNKIPLFKTELDNIKITYGKINTDLKEGLTYPISRIPEITTGKTAEQLIDIGVQSNLLGLDLYKSQGTKDFEKGVITGIYQDIKEQPLKQIVLLGAGAGFGAGFKAISTGLSAIPKVGGIATTTFKLGTTGYGVVEGAKVASATVGVMAMQEDLSKSGSVLGVTLKDTLLLGYGFTKGEKGFDILRGEYRTRGLKELQVPQGEYPQLPTNKQLEAFNKNVYKEISDEAIAFHTTPDVFYKGGTITPKSGTSELPGLYASTQVSTPFAKITGSGSNLLKTLEQFKKAIIDMFSAEKNPGIAALEPKGFREVKFGYSAIPQFKGQKPSGRFFYGGKIRDVYAYFETPPKAGFMDIQKMKTEIEAIARTDAGIYGATGKRFYTEISGVKVPIDAFKYSENKIVEQLAKAYKDLGKKVKEQFKPEDFPSYVEPTLRTSIPSLSALPITTKVDSTVSSSILSSSLQSSISKSLGSSKSSSSSSSSSISKAYSDISSSISKSLSSMASSSSVKSVAYPSSGSSSKGSSVLSPSVVSNITSTRFQYNQPKAQQPKQQRSLGQGYNVYGKALKSTKSFKINSVPLTKQRALDIGSYYVSQTLARTFKIEKTSQQAQPDYEFVSIPEGYYQSKVQTLREYKIRKGKQVETPESFIQKSIYALSSESEKKQIQNFRNQVRRILK